MTLMKFRFKKLKSKIKASSLFRETRAIKISIEHLFEFIKYSFKQAIRSYKRNRLFNYNSMLNYKRAHYLEKAMYCELEKTNDLNIIHKELSKYLETDVEVKVHSNEYVLSDTNIFSAKKEWNHAKYITLEDDYPVEDIKFSVLFLSL